MRSHNETFPSIIQKLLRHASVVPLHKCVLVCHQLQVVHPLHFATAASWPACEVGRGESGVGSGCGPRGGLGDDRPCPLWLVIRPVHIPIWKTPPVHRHRCRDDGHRPRFSRGCQLAATDDDWLPLSAGFGRCRHRPICIRAARSRPGYAPGQGKRHHRASTAIRTNRRGSGWIPSLRQPPRCLCSHRRCQSDLRPDRRGVIEGATRPAAGCHRA